VRVTVAAKKTILTAQAVVAAVAAVVVAAAVVAKRLTKEINPGIQGKCRHPKGKTTINERIMMIRHRITFEETADH
jgi:hypothetical protein